MSRQYKYGSIMRQTDDDPTNDTFNEGTIWVEAGDQSDGCSRTVIDDESERFVKVRSECVAVYGGEQWLSEDEAKQLAIDRSEEENLLENIEHE